MTKALLFQSAIAPLIDTYITFKQALGRRFENQSYILSKLDNFLCTLSKPSPDLTRETFKLWCQTFTSVSSNTRLNRMRVVRNFCLFRQRSEPNCFIPDPSLFPQLTPAKAPYIFLQHEIARLLHYSDHISNTVRSPLRGASTRLAVIILFTTGIRRSELLQLRLNDYDSTYRIIKIRRSKFFKERLLPIPDDVAAEIEKFLIRHQAIRPQLGEHSPLFWNPYCGGRAYSGNRLTKNIQILMNLAEIRKIDGNFPRIHDFRFSFAVNALLRWYRNGADVKVKLPYLAAYMGHASVISTMYYLKFVTPLRTQVSHQFAQQFGSLLSEVQ